MIALISIAAFLATILGGAFALRFKDKLHLILGCSAGAVIAVAFFDLLPESLELAMGTFSVSTILAASAIGFFGFMVLDRSVFLHSCHSEGHQQHTARGKIGVATLSVHSFLDGLAVGFAFQVSTSVGAVVAAAVLAHDFSDGINTVNLIIKNGGDKHSAWKWLVVDALAPVLGIGATFFFSIPSAFLGILLAVFSGFFLYIGASDLLPESHHGHPTFWTTAATILGALVLYGAIQVAGV